MFNTFFWYKNYVFTFTFKEVFHEITIAILSDNKLPRPRRLLDLLEH